MIFKILTELNLACSDKSQEYFTIFKVTLLYKLFHIYYIFQSYRYLFGNGT